MPNAAPSRRQAEGRSTERNANDKPACSAAAAMTRRSPSTSGSQYSRMPGSASDLTTISGLMPAASPMVMPMIGSDMSTPCVV
jgi:hypothetical protein